MEAGASDEGKPRTRIGRVAQAALSIDETVDRFEGVTAHVKTSLTSFDQTLGQFETTLARFGEVLTEFGTVLDRFSTTVDNVDATVARIEVVTDEMAEIVAQAGELMSTLSPAFTLNEQFRRQLERIRSLRPGGETPASDQPP